MKFDCLPFLVWGNLKKDKSRRFCLLLVHFRAVMTISFAQPFASFRVAYFVPARRRCVSNVTQWLIGVPPLGFLYGHLTYIRVWVTEATCAVASVTQTPWGSSTFKPLNSAWDSNGLKFLHPKSLPQIGVETLIGSQANYEIKIKITIYF